MAAIPDVGPALASAGLVHAALKGVEGAVGIGGGGLGLPQHVAQVEKMLLASAAFREIRLLPFGDEFLGCHTRCSPLSGETARTNRDFGDCSPLGDGVLASACQGA